jgi:phage FluMu protein Com
MGKKIFCAGCGKELDEMADGTPRVPCPECKSVIRHLVMEFEDAIEIHDSINARGKKDGLSGRAFDNFYGDDFSKGRQKWLEKFRVIDRENDRYFEKVWDPKSGEVLHECDEPLSKHTDHGSAKFRKTP